MPRSREQNEDQLRDPLSTSPRNYDDEEREFLMAVDKYKLANQRRFPTLCELLAVLHALGYRLVAEPTALPKFTRGLK